MNCVKSGSSLTSLKENKVNQSLLNPLVMELNHEIFSSLGMTLIHSLWQGTIVSVMILFLLGLIGKTNARLRYIVLFSGLMMLLAGFISTFIFIYRNYGIIPAQELSSFVPLIPADANAYQSLPPAGAGITGRIFGYIEPAYPALAIGWLTGFILIGLRMAGGLMFSRKKLMNGLTLPDRDLEMTFIGLQKLLKLPVGITLRISARTISPMITGLLKPVVIIPAAAITGLSTDQIEAVMVHELAHIQRYDHIMVILQAIAEQVLFYHPVTWILIHEINRERENSCDDFVVKTINNPINYIKALTMIQEMNLNSVVPANAITGKSNQLLGRIRRLVKPEHKHSATFRMAVVLLFFATIGVSAMTFIIAGKPGNLFGGKENTEQVQYAGNHQQNDSGIIMNGTVNATTDDKKDGVKKKMKIVFVNDTIKEMTVNGKPVNKSEMKAYENEIRKIRQEMESSQRELEKVNRQLREAQKEIEIARKELEGTTEDLDLDLDELSEFNLHFREPYLLDYFNLQQPNFPNDSNFHIYGDHLKNPWQNEEFREQMKKVQEEAQKAAEDMRLKHEEYWRSHQDEIREEMKKAKELFYLHPAEPFHGDPFPIMPSDPELGLPLIPEHKEMIPGHPENHDEAAPKDSVVPDQNESKPLDSKLRELEGETIEL